MVIKGLTSLVLTNLDLPPQVLYDVDVQRGQTANTASKRTRYLGRPSQLHKPSPTAWLKLLSQAGYIPLTLRQAARGTQFASGTGRTPADAD